MLCRSVYISYVYIMYIHELVCDANVDPREVKEHLAQQPLQQHP